MNTDMILCGLYHLVDYETDFLTISVFTPDGHIKQMEPVEVLLHMRENRGMVKAVDNGDSAMIFKTDDIVMVVSYTRHERLFSLFADHVERNMYGGLHEESGQTAATVH